MQLALTLLVKMMHQHFGKPVILLLDEYDAPIQQAWEHGFYTECIAFMKQFLSSVLKGNRDLDFAVLTGVLRVAKKSIFSDLNNLDVCSVMMLPIGMSLDLRHRKWPRWQKTFP